MECPGWVQVKKTHYSWDFIDSDVFASVSFWPLLIIESVARVSQHVFFTHDLLFKHV